MCNLYSHISNVEAIRRLFKVDGVHSSASNLPQQPSIFPAYDAPVVRLSGGRRELVMMRWGFLLPQQGKSPNDRGHEDRPAGLIVLIGMIRLHKAHLLSGKEGTAR